VLYCGVSGYAEELKIEDNLRVARSILHPRSSIFYSRSEQGTDMPYTTEQLQRIVQWLAQRAPKLMQQGCPLCGAPAAGFGVERLMAPDLPTTLLAVACRTCGHIMLFNEELVFQPSSTR
jgi:hypothetical protein